MSAESRQINDLFSMNKSVPELFSFLRHALGESHFKEVENILVEREEKAKLEIESLKIENVVLKKKCEVLSLECGGACSATNNDDKNGTGETERSAEEIYDQLVGEMVGGKGEKESDEVGRLKRENDELKRKNEKLRKLILDCVENYVHWNNKFLSLQGDVSKLKTLEVVGLDGISKNRSGENRVNRGDFMQNDDSGLSLGNVRRMLGFDVDENEPVGMTLAKEKETEIPVDQGSGIVPFKRAVEIIDINDDPIRASCEGNLACQKPIGGEHYIQSCASKGLKRKGYSVTSVVDLENDSGSPNGIHRLDSQSDVDNVDKDEELTQKVRSLRISSSSTSTHHVSDAEKVAVQSQNNVVSLRQCDGRNVKQRHPPKQLKMSVSGFAQTYDSEDCRADRPKRRRQWNFLGNMCADLIINENCMSAVCALYRQQKSACERIEGSLRQGFSSTSFERGTRLAEFLIDGDPECRLRKTAKELQSQFPNGLELCRDIAREHFKQLFEIYQKKLDAYYPEA